MDKSMASRSSYFFTVIMLFCLNASAQTIKGKVSDSDLHPLAYVNIGIVGKNIGTVSDEQGNFSFTLPEQCDEDHLRFSMIGFQSREFTVLNFKKDFLT